MLDISIHSFDFGDDQKGLITSDTNQIKLEKIQPIENGQFQLSRPHSHFYFDTIGTTGCSSGV